MLVGLKDYVLRIYVVSVFLRQTLCDDYVGMVVSSICNIRLCLVTSCCRK
jgi:hypothetical protein